ncbi:MAG: type II toxin-antitoxin system RelE/ParE family toxin [Myxococcaceae bacterium]|nr:type II toxin-antitoxin system RelE/ParE family toxin [Myxococcaceae bacterium]
MSKGRLRWSVRSLSHLAEIEEYIAEDDPVAAAKFIVRLRKRARAAAKRPMIGRRPPEGFAAEVREVIEAGYRVIYREEPEGITVLYVGEGHRLVDVDETDVDDAGDP